MMRELQSTASVRGNRFSLWPFELELNVSEYSSASLTEDFVLYVELNQSIDGFHYEQFSDAMGRDILFLSSDRSSNWPMN